MAIIINIKHITHHQPGKVPPGIHPVRWPHESSETSGFEDAKYPPAIKGGSGKCPISGGFYGKLLYKYKRWMFYCHVWLLERQNLATILYSDFGLGFKLDTHHNGNDDKPMHNSGWRLMFQFRFNMPEEIIPLNPMSLTLLLVTCRSSSKVLASVNGPIV